MKARLQKAQKKKTFKQAIDETPDVKGYHMPGKQAILKGEKDKVDIHDNSKCGGSLFIDDSLIKQKKYPNDNRWDYAIDYNGEVYFFEIHTANSGEVSTVIKKLDWLINWLKTQAPEISKLKATKPYYWIQSGGYNIPINSKYERAASQRGIKPISKLVLK